MNQNAIKVQQYNFQVEKIEMPKRLIIVVGDSEVDVSKHLFPTRKEARTNRPIFDVIETETTYIYSLIGMEIDLEKSLKELEPCSATITPSHCHRTNCQASDSEQCCEDENGAVESKKAQLFLQSDTME